MVKMTKAILLPVSAVVVLALLFGGIYASQDHAAPSGATSNTLTTQSGAITTIPPSHSASSQSRSGSTTSTSSTTIPSTSVASSASASTSSASSSKSQSSSASTSSASS